MANATINSVKPSVVWDSYRFGDGPELVLKPGTMGWSASDFENPVLRRLWDEGRYEVLNGVLTIMPAAYFRGGACAYKLLRFVEDYLRERKIAVMLSTEVDIQLNQARLLRPDSVAVFGEDLSKFSALKFKDASTDWRDHALIIPPTLVIESVSKGHEIHDRQTKRKWYAEFGVKHYWIVDGFSKSLDCLLLQEDHYISEAAGSADQVLTPGSFPGLTIPLNELWGD